MAYSIPKYEMETTVRTSADDKTAYVFSADPVFIRKLDKACASYPDEYRCVRIDEKNGSKWYEFPKKRLRFGRPASAAKIEACHRRFADKQKTEENEYGQE